MFELAVVELLRFDVSMSRSFDALAYQFVRPSSDEKCGIMLTVASRLHTNVTPESREGYDKAQSLMPLSLFRFSYKLF